VVVTVLDLMMSVTEDRPPLEALGAGGSTVALRSPKRAFRLRIRSFSWDTVAPWWRWAE
jgi:hypothetical protein